MSSSLSSFDQFVRQIITIPMNEMESSVRKATYEDDDTCKEKHVKLLIDYTYSDSVLPLIENILERFKDNRWQVVNKALLLIHRLFKEANVNFFTELSTSFPHCLQHLFYFQQPFCEQQITTFIQHYSEYLQETMHVFQSISFNIHLDVKQNAEYLHNMSLSTFLSHLQTIATLFNKIFSCQISHFSPHPIILSCILVLFKDSMRFYSLFYLSLCQILDQFSSYKYKVALSTKPCIEQIIQSLQSYQEWIAIIKSYQICSLDMLPDFNFVSTILPAIHRHLDYLSQKKKLKKEKAQIDSPLNSFSPPQSLPDPSNSINQTPSSMNFPDIIPDIISESLPPSNPPQPSITQSKPQPIMHEFASFDPLLS